MKHNLTYTLALALLLNLSVTAQNNTSLTGNQKNTKQELNYDQLKNVGYKDKAIYEDLGNANFLSHKYEIAVYWYRRLQKLEGLSSSYQERYTYALSQTSMPNIASTNPNKDWVSQIKKDYEVDKNSKNNRFIELDFLNNSNSKALDRVVQKELRLESTIGIIDKGITYDNAYDSPITMTADGKTAYFSKAITTKPSVGMFSKKQIIHKTFRAEKINGEWSQITELNLSPKYYSATHPTVSADGKRLFFASNMPGTFGKYDIYVSEINNNGTPGIAKNLGKKVNTKKNDLYPKLVNGTSLFFASEGRNGYGGLDIYLVEVLQKKVGYAVNLGGKINSKSDDFAIAIKGNGEGYVVSNRGNQNNGLQKVAFTMPKRKEKQGYDEFNSIESFTTHATQTDYTSSLFEDE